MKTKTYIVYLIVTISMTVSLTLYIITPPSKAVNAQIGSESIAGSSHKISEALPDVQISIDEIVASGFDQPVQVTHAGDGSGRLFVVEKTGKIKIIKDGEVLENPFLDLSIKIATTGNEQGLLGLAFHPEYETNGFFYVDYTRLSDGATVVARYSVSGSDPDIGDPSSEFIVLTIDQPRYNHNGGQLMFGPNDGYLYISLGDGGIQGDPDNHGQNLNTLLGSILRIDIDVGGDSSPYLVPVDNPFVDKDGLDEIWAYGFRNPWRFSFDRLNGDLYIGDVGYRDWEEIDYQASGTPGGNNFGWRCKEGDHYYNFADDCPSSVFSDPIAEYYHFFSGASVTGGFVYRGSEFPDLVGRYFYGDYIQGKLWSLYKQSSAPDSWSAPELELDTDLMISSFGEDEEGELYVADYGGGTIRRLGDAAETTPDLSTSKKMVSPPSADPNETVTYMILIKNTGLITDTILKINDNVPPGLEYTSGSLQASHGTWDDSAEPLLIWQGNLIASQQITITYQAVATGLITGSILNEAAIIEPGNLQATLAASLSVPRSRLNTTKEDFFIPGTQPEMLNDEIPPADNCKGCHSEPIYDRWRGSMKSQAGRDPIFWAALSVANINAPDSGEYCLRCHTPKGLFEGRSHPADGSLLEPVDIAYGVTCNVCHRSVDPIPSVGDEAAPIDLSIRNSLSFPIPSGFVGSSALIIDPDDNRRGPFSFNLSHPYHTAYQTDFLRQTGDAITRSRMCGTCHNVHNPVLSWNEEREQYWPNESGSPAPEFDNEVLFPVETTFDEWLYSDFARGGVYAPQFAGEKPDGIVRTCQDCHMQRITGYAADQGLGAVYRDCQNTGCVPEHVFVGGNTWVPKLLQDPDWRLSANPESFYLEQTVLRAEDMLGKAAQLTIDLSDYETYRTAAVRVTNLTGHKLPTGYPEGRRMWINLKAYNENDQVIYESGVYNPSTGQLDQDPKIKVYEIKQGITPELAKLLSISEGESFHFVLNNTVIKDNRIPPQGYTKALYDRPGLRPVGTTYSDGQNWDQTTYLLPHDADRVEATLYYQTSSKEYIDFLRKQGGVDGRSIGEMWDKSKSPPQIMAQVNEADWVYIPSIELLPIYSQGIK